mmetsp:Transcript_129490/g.307217  ORF Transcript_129490/g.307217 Transcript_129490/m.307217 type:complete len:98 (-) Transcript_129490:443-736(-)
MPQLKSIPNCQTSHMPITRLINLEVRVGLYIRREKANGSAKRAANGTETRWPALTAPLTLPLPLILLLPLPLTLLLPLLPLLLPLPLPLLLMLAGPP